jgi:hypothetical protein
MLTLYAMFFSSVWVSVSSAETAYIPGSDCQFSFDNNSSFSFNSCSFSQGASFTLWQDCLAACCPKMPQGNYTIPSF